MIKRLISKFNHFFYNIKSRIANTVALYMIGKRKKKGYYIISRKSETIGLFSFFVTTIKEIEYADRNGLIPYIDLKTNKNQYHESGEEGIINTWDYYFKQDTPVWGVESIYNNGKGHGNPPFDGALFENRNGICSYYRKLTHNYVKLSDEAVNQINNAEISIFLEEKRVLGVLLRGTDYLAMKPSGHRIQPDVDTEAIPLIEKIMKEKEFQYIYLCTEDTTIITKMRRYFGEDKIIVYDRQYIEYNGEDRISKCNIEGVSKKQQGMDYLVQVMLLTKCKGLITGITSGSVGLMCLSERDWEYVYAFDLGTYE